MTGFMTEITSAGSTVAVDEIEICVPEPGAMALLGLGSVGLLIRRKRAR